MKEKEARAKFRQVGVAPFAEYGPDLCLLGLACKKELPLSKWPVEGPLGFACRCGNTELGHGITGLPAPWSTLRCRWANPSSFLSDSVCCAVLPPEVYCAQRLKGKAHSCPLSLSRSQVVHALSTMSNHQALSV